MIKKIRKKYGAEKRTQNNVKENGFFIIKIYYLSSNKYFQTQTNINFTARSFCCVKNRN